MSYVEKEKLIKADIASIENRVRHAFNQGYDLGYKKGKERAKAQEPTTKNDLGVDCVARQDIERYIEGFVNEYTSDEELQFINLELYGLKHIPSVTPQEPKWLKSELIKLIDKTYEDFNNAPSGETWCEIDGNEYYSDMGYAFEGINMFVDVLKSRIEGTNDGNDD